MKTIAILLLISFLTSCAYTHKEEKTSINSSKVIVLDHDPVLIQLGSKKLALKGLNPEDFSLVQKGKTLFIIKKLYLGIDDLQIEFIDNKDQDFLLTGEIEYAVSQNLIDDIDRGNVFLPFSFKEDILLHNNKGKFILSTAIKTTPQLEAICHERYFDEIRKESYLVQKQFYQNEIIDNPEKYKDCCPEYIEYATQFLSKKELDFHSLQSLFVEFTYKKITLNMGDGYHIVFNNISDFVPE
ncbi:MULTISPECIES: hypothetical protein [unclassified Gilliamella]|uniref:hypothetical protein n=1 Tax=unclassified Gilliamella TaxID=2685620 RepID=UPI002269B512|nr:MULTISPECIES: hypothetical protein [unclassified Gilliamella]MCX8596214.1 hypothetical protein [Gilliamella sp. B3493]MCX8598581.1 hypothetical protein [Gilliamella sp. B3486]MCX8689411.1 hypothetical protein [Gilliamella sp. B2973]MCX8705113.1 hypothetical protein [Gilliamella sp. B3127]